MRRSLISFSLTILTLTPFTEIWAQNAKSPTQNIQNRPTYYPMNLRNVAQALVNFERHSTLLVGEAGQRLSVGNIQIPEPPFENPQRLHMAARPFRLDGRLRMQQTLRYQPVFHPSLIPFRRDRVFDQIDRKLTLSKREEALLPVQINANELRSDEEAFWGQLTLQLSPKRPTPIPSVATEQRFLQLESHPSVALQLLRDSAGNYSLKSARELQVTLRMLIAVPQSYFAVTLSETTPLSINQAHPETRLPAKIKRAARQLLGKIGVNSRGGFASELGKLVAWFRSFKEGEAISGRGLSLLTKIVRRQRGVCRHRALAFWVLARAAGLPTYYVQNEAHAFVEVMTPGRRWTRIDLGGATARLAIEGGGERLLHQPSFDPFPQPASYIQQYSHQLHHTPAPEESPATAIFGQPRKTLDRPEASLLRLLEQASPRQEDSGPQENSQQPQSSQKLSPQISNLQDKSLPSDSAQSAEADREQRRGTLERRSRESRALSFTYALETSPVEGGQLELQLKVTEEESTGCEVFSLSLTQKITKPSLQNTRSLLSSSLQQS